MKTRRRPRALTGRRVVVTRRREQAGELRKTLECKGAKVIELPTIELAPPLSWVPVDAAIRRLESYDWVVFTSTNGVDAFLRRLRRHGKSAKHLSRARLAAIGPATARALKAQGLRADVVPDEFRAEGLLAALGQKRWRGQRVLLARAAKAREILPMELQRRGARVSVVAVYRTVLPERSRAQARRIFDRGRAPDAIAFTSSSTVKNFFALHGRRWARKALAGVAVATIGPVTSRTARALGLRVDVEANPYTVPALAQALERHCRRRSSLS